MPNGQAREIVDRFKEMVDTIVNKTAIGRVPTEAAEWGRKILEGDVARDVKRGIRRGVKRGRRMLTSAASRIGPPPSRPQRGDIELPASPAKRRVTRTKAVNKRPAARPQPKERAFATVIQHGKPPRKVYGKPVRTR